MDLYLNRNSVTLSHFKKNRLEEIQMICKKCPAQYVASKHSINYGNVYIVLTKGKALL